MKNNTKHIEMDWDASEKTEQLVRCFRVYFSLFFFQLMNSPPRDLLSHDLFAFAVTIIAGVGCLASLQHVRKDSYGPTNTIVPKFWMRQQRWRSWLWRRMGRGKRCRKTKEKQWKRRKTWVCLWRMEKRIDDGEDCLLSGGDEWRCCTAAASHEVDHVPAITGGVLELGWVWVIKNDRMNDDGEEDMTNRVADL